MTSMISELYKYKPEKKMVHIPFFIWVSMRVHFWNFVMRILRRKSWLGIWIWIGWYFYVFGTLQFWLAQNIFGETGLKPVQKKIDEAALNDGDKRNPFQTWQLFIIGICVTLAMAWLINSPMTKISKGALNIFNFEFMGYSGNTVAILTGLVLFYSYWCTG